MVDRPNGCTTKMMRTATTITTIAKMATIAAFDPPSPCVLATPYLRETIRGSLACPLMPRRASSNEPYGTHKIRIRHSRQTSTTIGMIMGRRRICS